MICLVVWYFDCVVLLFGLFEVLLRSRLLFG